MKAGKEEIAGLVRAVERYVGLDHAAEQKRWMGILEGWRDALADIDGIAVRIEPLNEAGQPIPRLQVQIDDAARAARALAAIESSRPRVVVLPNLANGVPRGLWLTPDLLQPGEAEIVERTVARALADEETTTWTT